MARCECCNLSVMVWDALPNGGVRLVVRETGETIRELNLSAKGVRSLVESLGGTMPTPTED